MCSLLVLPGFEIERLETPAKEEREADLTAPIGSRAAHGSSRPLDEFACGLQIGGIRLAS
jgi:hypothetical protein